MEISIMKKQIIAAAVAASLSAVALADVSITGSAKVNWTSTDAGTDAGATRVMTHELDYNVVGKTGDTAFHTNIESTNTGGNAFAVKNQYMTTKVGNFDVKMGNWYTGDSNLNNGGKQDSQVQIGTSMGPATVTINHMPNISKAGAAKGTDHNEIHLKTDLAGIKVGIERENTDDHMIYNLSGELGGVNFSYTDSDSNIAGDNEQNLTIKADVAGFGVEYHQMESETGTTSDGFFGTFKDKDLTEASGFGVTTSLAGNKVHLRNYETNGSKRDNKVIVTRTLASGATAEVTYVNGDSDTMLDVELLVKF
jgi:hypothetical protein